MEKEKLDEFFEKALSENDQTESALITLRVPKDCKHKYEELQLKTKKKFGKNLKAILEMAIDRSIDKISKM